MKIPDLPNVVVNPHITTIVAISESDLAPLVLRSGLQIAIINHLSNYS